MAELHASTDAETGQPPAGARGGPPRMPGWVKWPAIILAILIVVFLALRLFGVQHGPGMHQPGGGNPPASGAPGHQPGGSHG